MFLLQFNWNYIYIYFLSVCMFMCLIHQVWWFPNEYKQPYYCYFNVIDAVVNLNNASLNRMAFLTDNLVFPKASKTNAEPEKQQKFTNKNEKMNRSYFAEILKMYVLSYRRRWAEDSILIEDFFIAIHKVWARKKWKYDKCSISKTIKWLWFNIESVTIP